MEYFTIDREACSIGFKEHAVLDLLKPINDTTLHRRRLQIRHDPYSGNPFELKKIIETNSSLRVDFGWSFESDYHYKTIMNECVEEIMHRYPENIGTMMSDLRCSWIGFKPYDIFDKEIYSDLNVYSLIVYNNELINFQLDVIKFISEHKIYRQHAILRDERYKFKYFKDARKSRDDLAESYRYYLDAVSDICGLGSLPRDLLEQEIGCHFLHEPDLFFELLEFSILKGEIYG